MLAYHNLIIETFLFLWPLYFAIRFFQRYQKNPVELNLWIAVASLCFSIFYALNVIAIIFAVSAPWVLQNAYISAVMQIFWYGAIGCFSLIPKGLKRLPVPSDIYISIVSGVMFYLYTNDVLNFQPTFIMNNGLTSHNQFLELGLAQGLFDLKYSAAKIALILASIVVVFLIRKRFVAKSQRIFAAGLITFAIFGFTPYMPIIWHYYFWNVGTFVAFLLMSISLELSDRESRRKVSKTTNGTSS